MNSKRYRLIFKLGCDLPWYEPIDPTFTNSDFIEEYFGLFYENGYIVRSRVEEARLRYVLENGLDPKLYNVRQRDIDLLPFIYQRFQSIGLALRPLARRAIV
jgi:hypothetical protein